MEDLKTEDLFLNSRVRVINHDSIGKIIILKSLAESRYSLYQVYSIELEKLMVLKVFLYKDNSIDPHYQRESHLMKLFHENIIYAYATKDHEQVRNVHGELQTFSYILLEWIPHGDFWDISYGNDILLDTLLLRTYAHQLIGAVEYLHSKGIAHRDLKLENLMIDGDFNLKLIDFDSCLGPQDTALVGCGTKVYRAPELTKSKGRDYPDHRPADIFSVGVILFMLKYGVYPFSENPDKRDGYALYELLLNQNPEYWNKLVDVCPDLNLTDDPDFNELFMLMVRKEPKDRPTIQQIRESKWYKGPVLTKPALRLAMKKIVKNEVQDNHVKEKTKTGPMFMLIQELRQKLTIKCYNCSLT